MKIKVIYIQQDGLLTGSAISLRHFLNAIDRDVFTPVVLLCSEGPARKLYEDLGIKVLVYPFITFWTFPGPKCYQKANFKQLKALIPDKRLADFILGLAPDIVHINDKASLSAGISLMGKGVPIVQHSRSSYFITNCFFNKYLSSWAIAKYSDALIAISDDELDYHSNVKEFTVINNTVDELMVADAMQHRLAIRHELGVREDTVLIGMVGALNAKKGAWSFLDMASDIKSLNIPLSLKFILVGKAAEQGITLLNDGTKLDKTPKQYIEDFISANNLENSVILTGFRKDALRIMAAMDVLVVANSNGVLGRQPIEAQAVGVPVVASAGHSENSNVLKHNHGGLLVPSPVNTKDLVNSVSQLVKDPVLRKQLGANGRNYAKEFFSPVKNMRKIESIYKQLLGRN